MTKKQHNPTSSVTRRILSWCLLTVLASPLSAQINTESDDSNTDDEITVTDEEGREEVIEFPEAMTYDLDSLLNLYMAKTYLDKEDCNMRDIDMTYSREEYIERLSRMPTVMEMAYNDVVQKFIDRYTGRLRHSISYMLGASNFYMPVFEQALETYQLPLELKYLPIIESALNPNAVSRAGASGLWQFMIGTGKQYGLQVNSLLDERRDPVKASYAAARYLRDLYKVFGDWNLVIAAYNCGPEKINKAIHRSNGVKDYWQIYPYLPKETRGYVPAFIAANYVMTYYSQHNICPMSTRLPDKTDTVMVSRNVHLQQVAEVVGVSIDLLRSLNPMYRRDIVPGATEPSPIRLPLTEIGKFIDMEDSIYVHRNDELLTNRLEVEVKDDVPTYYHKSKRYTRKHGRRHTTGRRGAVSRKSAAGKRGATAGKRSAAAHKRSNGSRRRARR